MIDLSRIKDEDLQELIQEECSGRIGFRRQLRLGGAGLGGLIYENGLVEVDGQAKTKEILEPYRVNLELFNEGLGVYLQRRNHYFLYLIPRSKLHQIVFEKIDEEQDEFVPNPRKGPRFFRKWLHKSARLEKYLIQIYTTEPEMIELSVMLKSMKRIRNYFSKDFLRDYFLDRTS